tara:strand:- start:805 stop:1680 length:876 start_codon:yes stop_codon:yes gene_type:complete
MKFKKILVIGGSGFLGSHVTDFLTSKKFEVTVFDLKKSKYLQDSNKFIKGDISNYEHVAKAVKGNDIVYNFAGIADIKEANDNPHLAIEKNISGTNNILNACVKFKVKRFILASTVYVYSNQGGIYKATKQCCEILTDTYSENKNLKTTILRFGSLYGPRANNFNFVSNIINEALTKGTITRKGSGNEIRNYIHVYDASKVCYDILQKKYENDMVLINGSRNIKIKEFLKMISEILNNKVKIKYVKQVNEGHYEITPYSFNPKIAKKIISDSEIELGQGILHLINDINNSK